MHVAAQRETWEYLLHQVKPGDLQAYEGTMNRLGADGWELVSAAPLALAGAIRTSGGNTNAMQMIYKRRSTAS